MPIDQEVLATGREVSAAPPEALVASFNAAIERYLGWPYRISTGNIVDRDGATSDTLAAVVYVAPPDTPAESGVPIPADSVAAVIDVNDALTLDNFVAAYARIGSAKRLKKSPPPELEGATSTTTTLGIVFARSSDVPLERIAEELQQLNAKTPNREWPDMVVVASTGVVNYAVQFPGEGLSADYLPPAEGALDKYVPAMYIVLVMKPTSVQTFNKFLGYLFAHLYIFSPGAKIPLYSDIMRAVPKTAVVISGYQYDLKGNLNPAPPHVYQDKHIPTQPLEIEDRRGTPLATIQFIPWQDGGVILLRSEKLPLVGLLPLFGKPGLAEGGIVRPSPALQISNVLPVSQMEFGQMLSRMQKQSNLVVKKPQGDWIIQKIADEGSGSPFIARLFLGMLKLRDLAYPDPATRERFDKIFDFVPTSLMSARTSAREMSEVWAAHAAKVKSGEIARRDGRGVHIDENIDKELRKHVENFLNSAARVIKTGMQNLTEELGVDIGFLFQKKATFEKGLAALRAKDPLLADYIEQSRAWTERLIDVRNELEHSGWTVPRVVYDTRAQEISAIEPLIDGQPVTEFCRDVLDRVCCFVEEVSAHCLQRKLQSPIAITEIAKDVRRPEAPERFTVTLAFGGEPQWNIAYHSARFEEV